MKYILIVTLSILLINISESKSFPGDGSGTPEDPYQITTIEELQELKADPDAYYIIMNDIDATDTKNWNNGKGFNPIRRYMYQTPKNSFTGNIDGQGYTIKNLYINRPEEKYMGLFSGIADGAVIKNIKIENAEVIGENNTGIFVGVVYAYEDGAQVVIDSCFVTGTVTADGDYVGGFCGRNRATSGNAIISNCTSDVIVVAEPSRDNYIGGFCGQNYSDGGTAIITNCNSYGDVKGNDRVGGFCGSNSAFKGPANISHCYRKGEISATGDYVGGFCGDNAGDISNSKCESNTIGSNQSRFVGGFCGWNSLNANISSSTSDGKVEGQAYIGGFCGTNAVSELGVKSILSNCISNTTVSGAGTEGGFCGANGGIISYCVSTGNISGNSLLGGFCGSNSGYIKKSYSTGRVSGNINIGGFVGQNYASKETASISDCYSTGAAIGNKSDNDGIGGFCNNNRHQYNSDSALIIRCYSIGEVIGDEYLGGFSYAGSEVPNIEFIYCYWDTETSGISEADEQMGMGKTTSQMKQQGIYTSWDFINVWKIDGMQNYGYPYLRDMPGLMPPSLATPEDMSQINEQPIFGWFAVDNATSYTLQIDVFDVFDDSLEVRRNIFDEKLSTTSYSIPIELEKNKNYMWRVKAHNDDEESPWSQCWYFTLVECVISDGFSGAGDGTEVDPYRITNICQLQEMKNDLDAHYVIEKDIDATGTKNWNDGKGFVPIGKKDVEYNYRLPFLGTLNGQGFAIRNLFINRPQEADVGLFGRITSSCNINNLTIVDADITGQVKVGILCGYCITESQEDIKIKHCYCDGKLTGRYSIGSLCGEVNANYKKSEIEFNNCFTSGDIYADKDFIGGFTGSIVAGEGSIFISECESDVNIIPDGDNNDNIGGFSGNSISTDSGSVAYYYCLSRGSVTGDKDVGGFIGYCYSDSGNVEFTYCSNSGDIKGGSDRVGGFIGQLKVNKSNVELHGCDNSGEVYGYDMVGGIIGNISIIDQKSNVSILSCVNTGVISGLGSGIGGICGHNEIHAGKIRFKLDSNYADIKGEGDESDFVGGLIGMNLSEDGEIEIEYCSSTGNITGEGKDSDFIGGFTGFNKAVNGSINISSSTSNSIASGKGTDSDFIGGFIGGNYAENGEIYIDECESLGSAIGDGEDSDRIGGFCGDNLAEHYSAIIKIVSSISEGSALGNGANSDYVGGFCGINKASDENSRVGIDYCRSTGLASGNNYIGGFCGMNDAYEGTASFNYSYSKGSVNGTGNYVGGFCGYNYSVKGSETALISNCYSNGDITGNDYIGGFCGANQTVESTAVSKIENCYSIGQINGNSIIGGFCAEQSGEGKEEINHCFWNMERSGISESSGGEGRNSSEMIMQSTYAGWDFDTTWCMDEGWTYPHLQAIEDCDNLASVEDNIKIILTNAFPNPFSHSTTINYQLPEYTHVVLKIYDALGIEVKVLVNEFMDVGEHNAVFDGSSLAPGMYYYILRTGTTVQTGKMVLVR